MKNHINFSSWIELERYVQDDLTPGWPNSSPRIPSSSKFLFRGQASDAWELDTTLDRSTPHFSRLVDYYRIIAVAKTQIETFTSRTWEELDYPAIAASLREYDSMSLSHLPNYDFLIYLRHHGFPSPLLDWSRSLYIAAFFACRKPEGERLAIFVYQERNDAGKVIMSGESQLHVLGPNVKSHPRHFLQQGEYTLCLKFSDEHWEIGRHLEVFALNQPGQDNLWKLTFPKSEAGIVMDKLQQFNINSFSLFQTEEGLLESLSRQLIR